MPSNNSTRFDVAVYVGPEHVKAFRAALERDDDNCLLLDIERVIGAHLGGERIALTHGGFNYGEGVAEGLRRGRVLMDNTDTLNRICQRIASAHDLLEEFEAEQDDVTADEDNADKIERALYLLRQSESAVEDIVP